MRPRSKSTSCVGDSRVSRSQRQRAGGGVSSCWPTPTAKANHDAPSMRKWPAYASYQNAVKRTTPRLWEWMMGFPAGWTRLDS